jgi:hypothetical protein
MDTLVLSPFSAATFDWTLASGNRATTVVCKLTFPLQPGVDAPLAASQEPIVLAERSGGPDPESSPTMATDRVPYKAAADVVVTGFAYAPGERPAATVHARLVVGSEIDKTLEMTGQRPWPPDGRVQDPEPFERVPLRGFGPIAPDCPTRAQKLGGAPMLTEDWVRHPLPWTVDPAFFNVAPADQRLKVLRPNESILLFGLLRDREKFGMRLPGVQPRAFAQNGSGAKEVPLVADTLWIDTERALVVVTWRGQLPVGSTAHRVVVALQERDAALTWEDLERRMSSDARPVASPCPPPWQPSPPPPAAPWPSPVPAPVCASAPMPTFIGQRAGGEILPPKVEPVPAPPAPSLRRDASPLDLLWFDAAVVPKLRANRAWRALVDALELVASDDGASGEGEDRREAFQVLANGETRDVSTLAGVLAGAIAPDGQLEPPLVLTEGEVNLPFDPAELLKVTLAACKPIAPTDKAFQEVVLAVAAMADAAVLSDTVAQSLVRRLRDAFQDVKHALPPRYLESTAERALLDGRRYQRREVFGAPHVRALLGPPASAEGAPAYLPAGVASRLPLFPRFRGRLLAEVHPQVDHDDAHACALRVLAIARAVPRPA